MTTIAHSLSPCCQKHSILFKVEISYWELMAVSQHEDIRICSVSLGSADSTEWEVGGLLCIDELLTHFSNLGGGWNWINSRITLLEDGIKKEVALYTHRKVNAWSNMLNQPFTWVVVVIILYIFSQLASATPKTNQPRLFPCHYTLRTSDRFSIDSILYFVDVLQSCCYFFV